MAKARKKRSGVGSAIYAFFMILFVVAVGYGIFWVWGKLWVYATEYEGSQSKPVIEAKSYRKCREHPQKRNKFGFPRHPESQPSCWKHCLIEGKVPSDSTFQSFSFMLLPSGESVEGICYSVCLKPSFLRKTAYHLTVMIQISDPVM